MIRSDRENLEQATKLDEQIDSVKKEKVVLENRLDVLSSEVATTKKLFKYYKEQNVSITYNETKAVVKRNRIAIEAEIQKLEMELEKLNDKRNQLSIDVALVDFLDKEIYGEPVKEEPKKETVTGTDFPTTLKSPPNCFTILLTLFSISESF